MPECRKDSGIFVFGRYAPYEGMNVGKFKLWLLLSLYSHEEAQKVTKSSRTVGIYFCEFLRLFVADVFV